MPIKELSSSKRLLTPSSSPEIHSKKVSKDDPLNKMVRDIKSIFHDDISIKVSKMEDRIEELNWILKNIDDDDEKSTVHNEMLNIDTELISLEQLHEKFENKISKVTMDNIMDMIEYIPRNKLTFIMNRYIPKTINNDKKEIICYSCRQRIPTSIKFCPNCYSEISGDVFTLNEVASKPSIDHKDTLEEAMACYQGTQNRTFNEKFIMHLDKTMARRGIDASTISRDELKMIIKRGRYSEHFCDLNLLHHMYTGVKLPNISHLENRLRYRNELMKAVYKELHPNHKGKYLHGQFLLKVMLQMEGQKYDKNDFSSELKMRNVTIRHNREVKEMCVILKKRYPELRWDFKFTA